MIQSLPATHHDACELYRTRRDEFLQRQSRHQLQADRFSYARLGAFLAAAGALVVAAVVGLAGSILAALEGAFVGAFLAFVILHRQALARVQRSGHLARANEEALLRAGRLWTELVANGESPPPGHSFADDLDVFGRGSVSELLAWPSTAGGRRTLREWLLAPAVAATDAQERQGAVAELAPMVDFREELIVAGRMGPPVTVEAAGRFLSWCDGASPQARRWWRYSGWLLPLTTLVLLLLQATGTVRHPFWMASAVLTLVVARYLRRTARPIIEAAAAGDGLTDSLIGLMRAIEPRGFRSLLLIRSWTTLKHEGYAAHREMARLRRLLRWAEVRFSDLLHLVLQFTLLWDVHMLSALERWRARSGGHARLWIDVVGEVEALAALAGVYHAHPEWVFPRFVDHEFRGIDARGLGHPLLPVDRCVTNDVRIDEDAPLLVVTGSNMSGKSTLLRAIGVNLALANAGGPVCASHFALSPLTLFTAMRVRDSLTEGVSQFMAELQRLKRAVDLSAQATAEGGTVLFLFDDILYGTTAPERRKTVEIVLGRLIHGGAIGAIAGHDLPIDERTPFWPHARLVHFRERVSRDGGDLGLSFDYKLRSGRATGGTALKLLAQLGLG